MRYTVANYKTPSGKIINKNGVDVDYEVYIKDRDIIELSRAGNLQSITSPEQDKQILKAMEVIAGLNSESK